MDLECMKQIMDERDRRYSERFEAQEKALILAVASSRSVVATIMAGLSLIVALIALVSIFWKH